MVGSQDVAPARRTASEKERQKEQHFADSVGCFHCYFMVYDGLPEGCGAAGHAYDKNKDGMYDEWIEIWD